MSLKQQLLQDLRQAGLSPTHRFGQNFMIDAAALQALLDAAMLTAADRVIEVGPGTGILTAALLERTEKVLALEIDQGMVRLLQQRFEQTPLQLVHGDALENKNALHVAMQSFIDAAPGDWKLVANLPYDIAIPLMLNALCLERQPRLLAVTVQQEAAERLCARPGTRAWGASALVAQTAGQGHILRKLPPQCFYPRPRVQSVVLFWEVTATVPSGFAQWSRSIFAYRRKLVSRALRDNGVERDQAHALCRELQLDQGQRLEDLDAARMQELFAAVCAAGGT